VTAWAAYAGTRPPVYFVILAALFVSSVLLAREDTPRARGLLLLTALLVALSIPVAIYVGNRFYPGGWEQEPILVTGSLEPYQVGAAEARVYYYIPVGTLVGAGLAFATGSTLLVPTLLSMAYLAGILSAVLILFRRAHGGLVAGVFGAFLFLAVPPLSIFGRSAVLAYALPLVWFALALFRSPRAAVLGILVLGPVMIFAHPVGLGYVAATLVPLVLLRVRDWPLPGRDSRRLTGVLLTVLVIAFAYWTYTYLITLGVRQGTSLYGTILSYFAGPAEGVGGGGYIPRYALSGFEVFALAWSLPVAMSGAYLLAKLPAILRRRVGGVEALTILSAFMGSGIVFVSYLSYPSGESGQYLVPVGYMVVLLSAAVGAGTALLRSGKARAMVSLALVVPILFVGFYSPDWAPLEHPDFASSTSILPYRHYLEIQTARGILPANATVFYDYDFGIGGGLYKPIRQVIEGVYAGNDPARYATPPAAYFGMRSEPFSRLPNWQWDVIYSSGDHVIAVVYAPSS